MGSLTETIDLKRYGRLLAKALPRVITSTSEHERALAVVDALIQKGEHRMTAEEDALLDLLTSLIRDYEATVYPPREKSKPAALIAFLLEQRGLQPHDLWPILASKSRVSEILSGKRAVSKSQAKALAAFFGVSAALFL